MTNMTITLPDRVPSSEVSHFFIQGMADRMSMSYFKYGLVADAYPDKVDAIANLKLRLEKYLQTGNTEFLMDVANFAMIEFMRPRLEHATYTATDKSPGRVWHGDVDPIQDRNKPERMS